jgi:hypothetical protein
LRNGAFLLFSAPVAFRPAVQLLLEHVGSGPLCVGGAGNSESSDSQDESGDEEEAEDAAAVVEDGGSGGASDVSSAVAESGGSGGADCGAAVRQTITAPLKVGCLGDVLLKRQVRAGAI